MEHDHNSSFSGHGSTYAGAIFMSNRMTKKESFQRKLFSLPSSRSGFVKKVKMGMILFLFEHEERKLYGVFEATSDGALNIVPNAFLKSGMSFPAQVHFKTIWSCDPLHEDEFSDAIKENYFTPTKFKFGLTNEQVARLVQLFSLKKKIYSLEHQNFRAHIKFMKKPGKSSRDSTRMTGNGRFLQSSGHVRKIENDIDYTGFTGLSYCNTNDSLSCEKTVRCSEDYVVGSQHRLYRTVPRGYDSGNTHLIRPTSHKNIALEPQAPKLIHSTSSSSHNLRRSFPVNPSLYDGFPYDAPGSMSKQSTALGVHNPSLAKGLTFCTMSSMENQGPPLRNQPNPSHTDLKAMVLSCSDYLSLDATTNKEHYEGRVYRPPRASIDPEGYIDLQAHNDLSVNKCYDASNSQIYFSASGMFAAKGSDSLASSNSPHNALDYSEASQKDSGSRGYRYRRRFPTDSIPTSKDEDLLSNRGVSRFRSSSEALLPKNCSYSSKFQEDCSFKEQRAFHSNDSSEYHPTSENFDLCSNFNQERSSAFCRLYEAPQIRLLHSYGPQTNISLNDNTGLLSQGRIQPSKMTKVQRQPFIQDSDEQLESRTDIGFSGSVDFGNMEQNNKVMDEESVELSFMNFKRRSEIRKTDGEVKRNDHVEGGGEKIKRRKLVRPSFIEEEPMIKESSRECRNMYLSRKNIGNCTSSINVEGKGSSETNDSSIRTHEHSGNENIVESVIKCVCPRGTKNNSDGLRACRCNTHSTGALQEETNVPDGSKVSVEKLKKLVRDLDGERTAICEYKQNAAFITASDDNHIMNHEVSGRKICDGIVGSGSKKCDAIDEKSAFTLDGNLEKFSPEFDGNSAKLSAKHFKSVKAEERFDVVAYENTALLLNGKCKCENYAEKGAGNCKICDGNTEIFFRKSDTNDSYKNLEIRGKEKPASHAVNNDSSLLSVDPSCGNKISNEAVGKNVITSDANKSKILIAKNKHEEEKAESARKVTGFTSVFSVDCNFEDPVGLDIGNRPFSFNEHKSERGPDDYRALEVEMS